MNKTLLAIAIGQMVNAEDRPNQPENYYKLTNSAGRNVIDLNGFIGWWDDEALWLKNYLSEHEGEAVEIVIASNGGDVFTGQSMFNAIKAHKGTVTAYVDRAFSIASYIAMACDVVNIVKGGQMMVHAVSGSCYGTAADMNAYASLIENAGAAIANSYVNKTNKDLEYWTDIMSTGAGAYYSDSECVDIGLANAIIDPSSMTNLVPTKTTSKNEQEEKEMMTNNVPDPSGSIELARQKSVRALFNSLQARLKLPVTLLNEALDDETCTSEAASMKFANYVAPDKPPKTEPLVNFGNNQLGGNGSDAKAMVKNVLLNSAGVGELKPEFKKYAGMDLQNAARSLGVEGFGNSIATNALSSDDFKAVIGEITQEVVQLEATGLDPLFKRLCKTTLKTRLGEYGVTDYNEINGFGVRKEDGNFPSTTFTGEAKRKGNMTEGGLAVLLTRAAILNDSFGVIADLSRQAVREAYRKTDAKMFLRLKALAQEAHGADLMTLIQMMQITLQSRVTSNKDDLGYQGGLIMASPTDINTIKPICGTKTIGVDALNPAYDAFKEFQASMSCGGYVFGFAAGQQALEIALLHGREEPELIENTSIDQANGIGWTVVFDNDIQVCNAKGIVVGKVGAAPAKSKANTEKA